MSTDILAGSLDMAKLICFDLDGVLVDSTDWHYRSFNDAMKEIALDTISPEDHARFFNGLPTLKKLEMLVQQGRMPPGQEERFVKLKSDSFRQFIRSELEPDLRKIALVQQLKREFMHVAVVSNCNYRNTDLLLRGLGLLEEVDFALSSDQVVAPKPSPEGYFRAMLHFGVSPKETMIFEDSPIGLAAAEASGASFAAVANPEALTFNFVMRQLGLWQLT